CREFGEGKHQLKIEKRDSQLLFYPTSYYPVGFKVNPMQGANYVMRKGADNFHALSRNKDWEGEFISMLKGFHPSLKEQRNQHYLSLSLAEAENSTWLSNRILELRDIGVTLDLSRVEEGSNYLPRILTW